MWYLVSINSQEIRTVFGDPLRFPNSEPIPPKYPNLVTIMLGQKPDISGYLFLADQLVEEFTRHNSVPEGYDFIFRQSWGLVINESVIHRVIDTLRAESYPPMADYLDGVVKNDQDQINTYVNACLQVKQKYPKFTW